MIRLAVAALALAATIAVPRAQTAPPRPRVLTTHEALAKDILKELIEIDTTQKGSTAPATAAVASRLAAAGFPPATSACWVPCRSAATSWRGCAGATASASPSC